MSDVLRRLRAAFVPLAFIAALGAVPLAALHAAGGEAAEPPEVAVESPVDVLADLAERPADEKLAGRLASKAGAGDASLTVYVQSDRAVDFAGLASRWHAWTQPAGEHVAFVELPANKLEALAGLPGVARVSDMSPDAPSILVAPQRTTPDGEPVTFEPPSPAEAVAMRERAQAAPPWHAVDLDAATGATARRSEEAKSAAVAKAKGGPAPKSWHDIWRNHAAKEAWDLGFTGKGVKVAVLDSPVDFAHPDLQGTYATYEKGRYANWPIVFDPTGMTEWAQDIALPNENGIARTAVGASGIIAMNRVITPTAAMVNGTAVFTGCISSRAVVRVNNQNAVRTLDPNCSAILPASKSGRILHGYHPDPFIRSLGAEPNAVPAVLSRWLDAIVVDPNTAGVYDTVYVDLDYDRDFTDEKPMTKADPVGWRDINGNGIPDYSAGMLYWIADGQTPPPGAYLFGLDGEKPAMGTYVGILADNNGHATLCASNVASRGRLGVPDAVSLRFDDLENNGRPMPINPGMAKEAKIVSVGDIYFRNQSLAGFDPAWRFIVLGADPEDKSDDVQISSNSYGFSNVDADGWYADARAIDYYVRTYNPSLLQLYATGNGGPGYGIVAGPNPSTAMYVAASTQMGSTGWDSIRRSDQITYGDITPFSNRGPGGIVDIGPSVAADGAFATGSNPLNLAMVATNPPEFKRDGEFANGTWGGTSRATPVAAGLMAVVYDAFMQRHGRWPTLDEAKSIAMAGARFNGYDAFTTGAGVMDAADAARIAGGLYGVAAQPPEWTAGGFRGKSYPAFAHIQNPGTASKQTFTLSNVDDKPVEVKVSGQWLRRVGHKDIPFTSKPVTDEVGSPTSFNAPQYLLPIDRDWVPSGTDLMVVRMAYPLDQMDLEAADAGPWRPNSPKASYLFADNMWRLTVYQHTDNNDNQKLWNDVNGNGIVDLKISDFYTQTLDSPPPGANPGKIQNQIDYAHSEIEAGEYERFAYINNEANTHNVSIHHPLERWGSGIYIGLTHFENWFQTAGGWTQRGRTTVIPETTLTLRVDFYDYVDWPWLAAGASTLTIPAASGAAPGTATFDATMTVPPGAAYGSYVGALFADYARDTAGGDAPVVTGGGYELPGRRVTIPVSVNVAASYRWNGPVTFGGPNADDRDAPYNNGTVSGAQSWNWRPESGDWRYFFFDATRPPRGALSYFIARTRWTDEAERMTDIDTRFYGPQSDRYSNPSDPANSAAEVDGKTRDRSDPSFYGPYTLAPIVESPGRNVGGGRWTFDTSTGGNEDWVSAPAAEGLHELMLDNVLFSGTKAELPFETTVGSIRVAPGEVVLEGPKCTDLVIASDLPLDDVSVAAYGMHPPTVVPDQVAMPDDPDNAAAASYHYTYTLESEAAHIRFSIDGPDAGADLDLFVLYDNNGDGRFTFDGPNERIGESTSPTADEAVVVDGFAPAGEYVVVVHAFQVPANGAPFTLTIDATYGDEIAVMDPPSSIEAGKPVTLRVCPDAQAVAGRTEPGSGVIFLGPASSPQIVRLPVQWFPAGAAPTPVPVPPDGVFLPALLRTGLFGIDEPPPGALGRAAIHAAVERATR